MARSKDIDIDDSVFQKRAKELARKLGKDEKEFIKQQTGILAREVARMTPPFASFPKLSNSASVGSAKDIKAGKGAIVVDLLRICSTRKGPTVKWAKKTFGNGPVIFESQAAGGVLINEAELKAWHKINQRPNNRTKRLPTTSKYWVTSVVLNRYIKKEQLKVGRAKAAFYQLATKLGAKATAPANVKNNVSRVPGLGIVRTTQGKTEGTIWSREGGLFHTNKFLPMLRKNRLIKAVKRGEFLMRKAAKDSDFKVV